ncbi:MAG: hypothetical protein LBJ12_01855 [Oscillospiraceae bacterium]|jgi:hypothetical protein|nr:hypothetical protein [Oscillospiraceae bacterium]
MVGTNRYTPGVNYTSVTRAKTLGAANGNLLAAFSGYPDYFSHSYAFLTSEQTNESLVSSLPIMNTPLYMFWRKNYGSNPSRDNWLYGIVATTSTVTVSRNQKDAIVYYNTVDDIPNTVATSRTMTFTHNVTDGERWEESSTYGDSMMYNRLTGQTKNDSSATANVSADVTALKNYRAATMYQNGSAWTKYTQAVLNTKALSELVALDAAIVSSQAAVTARTNVNDQAVLSHFGLPTPTEITTLRANIVTAINIIRANVEYFHNASTGKLNQAPGNLFTPALTTPASKAAFQSTVQAILNPVNFSAYASLDTDGSGAVTATDFLLLWNTAKSNYYDVLAALSAADRNILKNSYYPALDITFADVKTWLDNLNFAYSLAALTEESVNIDALIAGTDLADVHKGAEVVTDGDSPWPATEADERADVPYSNARLLVNLSEAVRLKLLLDGFGADAADYYADADKFYALYTALDREKLYRDVEEPAWYALRNWFTAPGAHPRHHGRSRPVGTL